MTVTDQETELFRRLKPELRDSRGRGYAEVRRRLTPRYWRVWVEIFAAYAVIAAAAIGIAAVDRSGSAAAAVVAALCGGAVIGYALAFLALWFHEAAHFNIRADRGWNDLMANLAIGVWLGQDVRRYRTIHFGHHARHGATDDPERSYFEPLDWRFLVESLTGLKVLKVLRTRDRTARRDGDDGYLNYMLLAGLTLHAAVLLGAVYSGSYGLAVAWMLGVAVIFPFLGTLRQLLEHRDAAASAALDYRRVAHGRISRSFGTGPLASTLGGAGFNRHLIHHWDPSLSATRLAEMERYIEDTELAGFYRSRKTTYARTFRELFGR